VVAKAGGTGHRWSLGTARAILGEVRERTARTVEAVAALEARREALAAEDPEREPIARELGRVLSEWVRAMEALGVEVKGPWLVDFDNGRGYFCWRWPEEELDYFHGYDEGFAGRTRIQ
jgi:hypothetical protein